MWWKISTGAETSVQYSIGSATVSAHAVTAATNIDPTPVDTSSSQQNATTAGSYATPSVTPSSGRMLAVGSVAGARGSWAGQSMGSWTNSYTEIHDVVTGGVAYNDILGVAYLVLNGGVSTSTTGTFSATADRATSIIGIFKGDSGATNYNGTATLAGTGSITASGVVGKAASATLAGTGSISATGVVGKASTATLAGTGAISATGSVTSGLSGSATLTGTGAISATGVVGKAATATLTGTGAVTATGVVGKVATATLAGTGAITATGTAGTSGALTGTATLAGTGTITATGVKGLRPTATLAGTGTIAASGVVGGTGTAIDNPLYLSGRAMF
jgi:hypothetical protein